MKQSITIKEVAQKSGVSPSTVSFVLNNTEGQSIPEHTRKKILETVAELKYIPNYMARNIRNKQSKTIGVVTSYNVKYLYFLDMLDGILSISENNGYSIIICGNKKGAENQELSFIRYFMENRIDGLIFISSAHSEASSNESKYIELFKRYEIPYVVIYGYTSDKETSYVNMDFFQNSYDACKHLFDQGCKEIAYIAPLDKNGIEKYSPRTERDRISGYVESLSIIGKKESDKNVIFLPRDFRKNDYASILRFFQENNQIDGIVACWASYGMQVLNVARDLNIKIPDDLRVIALDSLPYLQHTYPGLTSMRLPFFEIAQKGTEILILKLSGESNDSLKLSISSELVIREST